MFILFGTKGSVKFAGAYWGKCKICDEESAISVFNIRTYFTLFFIPVIPINSKKLARCNNCGQERLMDKEESKDINNKLLDEDDFNEKYGNKLKEQFEKKKEMAEKFKIFMENDAKKKVPKKEIKKNNRKKRLEK